jgi:hypothetical protein
MKKSSYGWVLKFILAAILLGVGLYMFFANEVVFIITGVAIVLFSIMRVVPLMKTLSKESLRTINLIEIIFDFIIGAVLIYAATSRDLTQEPFWGFVYQYGLAFVFYVRGLVFFISVVFLAEKTQVTKFVFHLLALSLGVVIAVSGDFGPEAVGLFLLLIALVGALYLSGDGYRGYKSYRLIQKELNDGVEKTKDKEKQKKAPLIIEDEQRDETYVS